MHCFSFENSEKKDRGNVSWGFVFTILNAIIVTSTGYAQAVLRNSIWHLVDLDVSYVAAFYCIDHQTG